MDIMNFRPNKFQEAVMDQIFEARKTCCVHEDCTDCFLAHCYVTYANVKIPLCQFMTRCKDEIMSEIDKF